MVALEAGVAKEEPVEEKEETAAVPGKVAVRAVGGGRGVCADGEDGGDGVRVESVRADYKNDEQEYACADYAGAAMSMLSSGREMLVAPPHTGRRSSRVLH